MYAIGPLSVLSVSMSVMLVYCGQTLGWIRMPLGMEVRAVPLPNFRPISIVAKRLGGSKWQLVQRYVSAQGILCSMGTQPPPQKGAEPLKFSAHVYCGQTAGWIKMALGMEVHGP